MRAPWQGLGDGGSVPWSLGFGLYQGRQARRRRTPAPTSACSSTPCSRDSRMRVEEQLRATDQPEAQYEALKAYLMMYDPARFEAGVAEAAHVEADWEARLGARARRRAASGADTPTSTACSNAGRHRLAASRSDQALVDATRVRGWLGRAAGSSASTTACASAASALGLPRSSRSRKAGGAECATRLRARQRPAADHAACRASSPTTATTRASSPWSARWRARWPAEQSWVLGIETADAKRGDAGPAAAQAAQAADGLLGTRVVDDVRRLYLNEYRDTCAKNYIADVRLQPLTSISAGAREVRASSPAPDTPLVADAASACRSETTLLAPQPGAGRRG
jgi:type VI secretion system protein ImpL